MKRLKIAGYLLAAVGFPLVTMSVAGSQVVEAGQKAIQLASAHTATTQVKPVVTLPTVIADMNQAIADNADYGVETSATLIDLDNNKEYDAGESDVVFKAASTTKILAAVAFLHEVESGKATLTHRLDGMSAQQAIKQMIEISDNDAWAAIDDYLGSSQQVYADSIGLSSYSFDTNTISTVDEAKLLAQLYNGKLISSSNRALLYDYLEHTDSTNLIPAVLPVEATVYNKYGELDGNLHDAAIVDYQGRHFVLVIFTKNDNNSVIDYTGRVNLIHAITTTAFNDVMAAK